MFRLAEEVGRAHLGVDGLIGDEKGFGRPGEEVDADPAVKLAFRFGDVSVAGADQQVDGDIVSVPNAIAPTAWTPPRQ